MFEKLKQKLAEEREAERERLRFEEERRQELLQKMEIKERIKKMAFEHSNNPKECTKYPVWEIQDENHYVLKCGECQKTLGEARFDYRASGVWTFLWREQYTFVNDPYLTELRQNMMEAPLKKIFYEKFPDGIIADEQTIQTTYSSTFNITRCPICKSANTRKISTAKRVASVELFGLASPIIGKTRQCNSCGYKW